MGPDDKVQGPGQLAGRAEEKVVVVSEAELKREIDFSTGDRRTVSLVLMGGGRIFLSRVFAGRELDLRDSLRSEVGRDLGGRHLYGEMKQYQSKVC